MGQCFQTVCKCGDFKFFNLGIGFSALEPEVFEEILENPEFAKLKSLVHSPKDIYDCYYKVYYCKECKYLENHISFKLRNLLFFRLRRKCSKCGKVMKSMKDTERFWTQKIDLKCSKCGFEGILDMNEIIPDCWD